MRRVVITGLGTINPLGLDVETSFSRMLRGENAVGPITRFDTADQAVKFAACVDWDPLKYFTPPDLRKLDPFTMWALVATDEALKDAGIETSKESESARERYGCILGTGIGGITGIEEQHQTMLEKGPRRVSPHFVPRIMANAVSGQVAIRNGLLGTCFTTSSACASAGHAIGMAWRAIQLDDDPAAASRPFDKDRDGFVMGEGCGILVLEELERAQKRGARIYAEVKGFGSTDDAYHITAPREDGMGPARALQQAIRHAGIRLDEVDYINAHGTSTPYNDAIETRAIKHVFQDHAKKLAISSTKSMIGHLLGASAAVELVVTALSVHRGQVHPTRNYTTPDPACDLDYVPGAARAMRVRNALSNSLGFGGHNVSICIGQLA
jgi:3-oxoacyl-[acyl-carrier-protein] synthase II